ncbi:MAG: choice-of-anchor X domain-containing protein, partial [bacterium]
MKSISKSIFIGLLLVGFSNQGAWGAQDVVKTYHTDGTEGIYFKEGARAIVTAKDGTMTGGEKKVTIVPIAGSTFTLTLYDNGMSGDVRAKDGTYTGIIKKISTEQMSPENLQLVDYQTADIVVDLDNNGDPGTVTIQADYSPPEISDLLVSEPYFSPQSSPGQKDSATITFKSNEKGRYEILIDKEIPSSNPTGTMSADVDISYVWDGCDKYGAYFLEGTHTVQVNIWDEAGNQANIKTCYVWIDRTAPIKVFISLSDDAFSPGTSTGIQDTTDIILQNKELDPIFYQLTIDGRILLGGTGTISQNYFQKVTWGGLDETGVAFDEGIYTINLRAEDRAGNSAKDTVLVTIDNTPPRIDFLIDNSGGNPCYRDQEIIFVLQSSDWIGTTSVESDGGIGTCSFDARVLDLIDCGNGIYAEYYKVVQTDVGTFAYSAYFEDKAGNPAINNNEIFGTI